MELVEVEITGQVITARYGTLSTGDTLWTDQAFAEHLIYDCKGAKWPEPKVAVDPQQVAVDPSTEEVQHAALSTLPLSSLTTGAIVALETADFSTLAAAPGSGLNVQIRALNSEQIGAQTAAGANALTVAPASNRDSAAPVQKSVAELPPAAAAAPVALSKPAAKPAKKAVK